ncbi:MAG: M1 family metallopeptidase, partial [Dinghuibacter sp.]|nr:M1 family metallopeptidase [Dinghuibacter sp.]
MRLNFVLPVFFAVCTTTVSAQPFTLADTLRGTITPERAWWDLNFYDLNVTPNLTEQTIEGTNTIHFTALKPGIVLQVDLASSMNIYSAKIRNKVVMLRKKGDVWYLTLPKLIRKGEKAAVTITYGGKPIKAKRAPWDGGVVWAKDKLNRPWVNTACQELGASSWWPTKDHQYDEADSMRFTVNVPDTLMNVSNGRLRSVKKTGNGIAAYEWFIANKINNYNVAMNIGKYVHFGDTFMGENGKLTLDYYVLDYNLEKAKKQFEQVKPMLRAFEYWFGPYPFYSDGYKLVESEHLGMEHQSAVAYGNHYKNGYRGTDLSGSGWGLKWDFIIIHETGHEWFGNNITTKDVADMWVHESFTNYSETLFTGYYWGEPAADEYNRGTRKNIRNDKPIIGPYNVNQSGSGDMYPKGGNMLHTIRKIIGNDALFRSILRGLNKTYWHQTVTTKEIEDYVSQKSGIDFSKTFDQYLRSTKIPELR